MKEIQIDLSQPFEKVLEVVLALPNRSVNEAGDDGAGEKELREAIRGRYEAANGRQVETGIGMIPIAPPLAPFLKATPFRAATLKDFLVAAAAQIVSLPLHCNGGSPTSPIAKRQRKQRTKRGLRLKRPPFRARTGSRGLPAEGPDFRTPQITAAHHD
jgi:hypothetical protein